MRDRTDTPHSERRDIMLTCSEFGLSIRERSMSDSLAATPKMNRINLTTQFTISLVLSYFRCMNELFSMSTLTGLLALTFMEIMLGIDNVIFV